jgi:hypothetical protein
VLRQQGHVVAALAQRRQVQGDHVQAEEQVLAEPAGRDLGAQVLVGGGQDAHVHRDRLAAADALDLARLQRAQQLGLRLRPQVADLVQEERAPAGQLEAAAPPLRRAGEGAPLVAEQLRLHQVARDGRAVEPHEGPAARGEWRWMAAATSSLPVPDSPVISTRASVGATRSISSRTASIAALRPPSRSSPPAPRAARGSARAPGAAPAPSAASAARPRGVSGFSMKWKAPSLVARTASESVARPLIMTTGSSGAASRIRGSTSSPFSRRHVQVHQHRVRLAAASRQPAAPGPASRTGSPLGAQQAAEHPADVGLVVDDQDGPCHHHGTPNPLPFMGRAG